MNPAGEGDPAEGKRLLELVAFARRDQDSWRFSWRLGLVIAIALISLFTALRTWTTWRSFHRPIEVQSPSDISAAEQGAMIAAIRARYSGILDPLPMDSATFQSVFLGRERLERSVWFIRESSGIRADVWRSDGGRLSTRRPMVWSFTFDRKGALTGFSCGPKELTIF